LAEKKNKSSIVVPVTSGLLFLKMIDMCLNVIKTCWLTYLRHVVITVWVNTENRGLTDEITDIDFKIGLIRLIFQFHHKHLAVAFNFLWVERS